MLVTNPGGPGSSGIDFLGGGGPFNDEINRRFDVVSWDPRGVGRSEPLACGTQIAELFLTPTSRRSTRPARATLERGRTATPPPRAARPTARSSSTSGPTTR